MAAEQRRTAEIIRDLQKMIAWSVVKEDEILLLEVLDRLIRLDQLHDQVASQHRNMLQNLSYLPERHSKGS